MTKISTVLHMIILGKQNKKNEKSGNPIKVG